MTSNIKHHFTSLSLFLVLALLLTTPNFSVAMIAITLIVSVVFLFKNRTTPLIKFDKIVIAIFCAYFLSALPVAILDGSTLRYFQGGARLLACLPIYFFFRERINSHPEKIITSIQFGALVGSVGACAFSLYQHFILGMPRVDGYLFSINFGYLACTLCFLCLGLSYNSKHKALLYLGAVAAFVATLFTFTRGAILATPILLGVMLFLNLNHIQLKKVIGILVAFALISVVAYHTSSGIKARTDYTVQEISSILQGRVADATSSGGRLQLWNAAGYAFKQAPTTGLPYQAREALNQELFEDNIVSQWVTTVSRGHAHNQYFEMLASTGVWGIVAIVFVFLLPLSLFTQHFLTTGSPLGYTATLFVAGFMVYGLTEVLLQANLIGSFYGFMLAVFFAMVYQEKYPQLSKGSEK